MCVWEQGKTLLRKCHLKEKETQGLASKRGESKMCEDYVKFLYHLFIFSLLIQTVRDIVYMYFPCGSAGKESACDARDLGSIPGLGRFPWRRERLTTPVQWVVHGVAKSQTQLSDLLHFTFDLLHLV